MAEGTTTPLLNFDGGERNPVRTLTVDNLESADAIVRQSSEVPVLFKGLCRDLKLVLSGQEFVEELLANDAASLHAYRVFVADDKVERLSFKDFVARSRAGSFAYLETASTDPRYCRGDHVLELGCSPESLEPRPLQSVFPEELNFKTRAYMSLLKPPHRNVAEWHYDGYDQVILCVFGELPALKAFEISAPQPAAVDSGVSAWTDKNALPSNSETSVALLEAGDVLYLPSGWQHRVTTRGQTFTVNWGYLRPTSKKRKIG